MPHLDGLSLPIDEAVFLRSRRGSILALDSPNPDSSLLAQMIKLHPRRNQRTNKLTAASPGVVFEDRIIALSQDLNNWHVQLPYPMNDTPANLRHWVSLGLGRIFVAVYLGYYHFGQLLFYQFLHPDSSSESYNSFEAGKAHAYAQACKAHSVGLCDITYAANSKPGCEVLYTMVGHVLAIASTVQIHILLFGEDDSRVSAARSRLERNFEILTRLRAYWPALEASFSRLRAFHRACQKSVQTSFRLDQSMLSFLEEFAKPMDDRGWRLVGRSRNGWLIILG